MPSVCLQVWHLIFMLHRCFDCFPVYSVLMIVLEVCYVVHFADCLMPILCLSYIYDVEFF